MFYPLSNALLPVAASMFSQRFSCIACDVAKAAVLMVHDPRTRALLHCSARDDAGGRAQLLAAGDAQLPEPVPPEGRLQPRYVEGTGMELWLVGSGALLRGYTGEPM